MLQMIIIYLLKVCLSMGLFYALHMLLLRGETFFKLRRAYFLVALLFSLIFPFIPIQGENTPSEILPIAVWLSEIEVVSETVENAEASAWTVPSLFSVLVTIICIGIVSLFIRFLLQTIRLSFHLRKQSSTQEMGKMKVIEVEDNTTPSFSFFRWIVVNKKGKKESQIIDILNHEYAHAKQWHSLDVLLYEIFCITFWWNPFAWLMKNEMKLNLEFLADKEVVDTKEDYKDYQYTLLQISIANTGVAFINNFNIIHLKKRITMMNKKRSSRLWIAKYLLIIPLSIGLVQCNNAVKKNVEENALTGEVTSELTKTHDAVYIAEQMPEYPGGKDKMMKYIADNLKYPEAAQEAGVEGRFIIQFVVGQDGIIANVKSLDTHNNESTQEETIVIAYGNDDIKDQTSHKDIEKQLIDEAIRVIKTMPKWTPGKEDGKEVAVYVALPIAFKLR